MKRMWKGYQQHRDMVLVLLGLLAVSLITLPYLVLGEGSYVQVHDQLDGEVLNYIYQARYLGQGNVIPQFMNGMDKASMLPPAPLGVLLYKMLPPFAAYAVMHWLCLLAGFLGMYGLCKRLGIRAEAGWATACVFCYIPFYPTYGLAALGQPMLVLSAMGLGGRHTDPATAGTAGAVTHAGPPDRASEPGTHADPPAGARKKYFLSHGSAWRKSLDKAGWYLAIVLYGACSSLTLVGYVWVAAGFVWTFCLAVAGCRKKKDFAAAFRVGSGTLALLVVYLVTNRDLLRALAGEGFSTHRQEMALRAAEHPLASFKELIFSVGSYSPVYSVGILAAAALLTLAAWVLSAQSKRNLPESSWHSAGKCLPGAQGGETGKAKARDRHALNKSLKAAWGLIGLIVFAALLAVLWNSSPIVSLRLYAGGMLTYFQADRIYWCFPFLWMLVLGLLLESICSLGKQPLRVPWQRFIPVLCCLLLLGIEGLQILRDSPLNKNVRLMLLKDYKQMTWESIYMDGVFARIDQAIGAEKDNFSVVSLGIYPSVALYHGYTCADGYSNNYDLAYKHVFRRIMARELEENPESLRYFDEWGNRLYLAGAPYGINGLVPKGQPPYTDLDYDLNAMQALNIRYLLSAAPIELSQSALQQTSLRLTPVEGSPFTDDTAYYEVWVYQLTPSLEAYTDRRYINGRSDFPIPAQHMQ